MLLPPLTFTIFIVFPVMKLTFGFPANSLAIYCAASIFLSATKPGPYSLIESAKSLAASYSPSDRKTLTFAISSSTITLNFSFSAFYCSTYLDSIECMNSAENYKSVSETSSNIISNSNALF